jgi:hypothetical protein
MHHTADKNIDFYDFADTDVITADKLSETLRM